jgi:predicted nucleic acid-binding protein
MSADCSDFLALLEEGGYRGLTSVNVLTEVLHRMMMMEARTKNLVKSPGALKQLSKKPDLVRRLVEYSSITQVVPDMGIRVLPLTPEHLLASQAIRAQYGLLINDSLIVTMMKESGVNNLATNDEAFRRVDGIRVYGPADIRRK